MATTPLPREWISIKNYSRQGNHGSELLEQQSWSNSRRASDTYIRMDSDMDSGRFYPEKDRRICSFLILVCLHVFPDALAIWYTHMQAHMSFIFCSLTAAR